MRLPYYNPPPSSSANLLATSSAIPSTKQTPEDEDASVLARIKQRRGPRGLLELDRALLHSPPVADGWSSFLGAIRTRTTLPTDILELIICRVAVLNRAQYEWDAHSRLLRQALFATGSSEDTVDAVVSVVRHSEIPDFSKVDGGREIELSGKTREMYRAVMAYTDAMTRNVVVGEEVWGSVKMWFPGEREMVEVTATVAAYNCVSRFLVALEVGERVWDGDEEKKS